MSTMFKKSIIGSAVALGLLAGAPAMADVSANIGVTSNYVWRGVTQNGGQGAVSGGLDYSSSVGIYAGTWISDESWTSAVSSTGPSYEQDLYAGYKGTAGAIGYDVGYIDYTYPGTTPSANFGEVYLGGSYKMFSAKVSYDSKNKNMYTEAAVDFSLPAGYGLSVHAGSYHFDAPTASAPNYTDYALTLSKGDFSLALTSTSHNKVLNGTDAALFAVSYTKSF